MFDFLNELNDHGGAFQIGGGAIFNKSNITVAQKVIFDGLVGVMRANGVEFIQQTDVSPTLMYTATEPENPNQCAITRVVKIFNFTWLSAVSVCNVEGGEFFNKVISKFNHALGLTAERMCNALGNNTGNNTNNSNYNFSHKHTLLVKEIIYTDKSQTQGYAKR